MHKTLYKLTAFHVLRIGSQKSLARFVASGKNGPKATASCHHVVSLGKQKRPLLGGVGTELGERVGFCTPSMGLVYKPALLEGHLAPCLGNSYTGRGWKESSP